MLIRQSGGDLFIVDNSVSGWSGLRYLEDWTEISSYFDIATGFFDIGALLELDGKWQQLEKIRILMGSDVMSGTRTAILAGVIARLSHELDVSLEKEKDPAPFLEGVGAIVAALASGKIECRVYDKEKFHAKAYITHSKIDVVGSVALVGSSNFTKPGLTRNIELNIQVKSGQEVAQLQDWFEEHWKVATEVTSEVLNVIERHVKEHTPFEVYAKALHELLRGREITAGAWDTEQSRMFPYLDRYQQEAYWALMKIASQHGGAFLCDGVGLGKTFVGLMLIERLLWEGKRVVLFAPKGAKEAVWEPHLRQWLGGLSGVGEAVDFSNLAVFSHTDLTRGGDFPARFERIADMADAVIIDEAHHFRNPGRVGTDEVLESRYRRLVRVIDSERRPKSVFLLTATPINNRLTDFKHLIELFSHGDNAYFSRTLGISNLAAHFGNLEKQLRKEFSGEAISDVAIVPEAQELLNASPAFKQLVVQRSRAYAKESQIRETGSSAAFPERKPPQVAEYSIKATYGKLLDDVEKAFSRSTPLFSLAMYYPLAYYKGPDDSIDPLENNRQFQVVGLIRTNFLKRFESSVWAFERSCDRLLIKLLAFVEVHSVSPGSAKRLERWKNQNAEILGYAHQLQLALDPDDVDGDEDLVPPELLEAVEHLSEDEYRVEEILDETFLDLDQIVRFLEETRKFRPSHDDKLQKLIRLLKSKDLVGKKVLIFSEYADTARYVARHLEESGIDGVEELDSGSKKSRVDVITRFSPYYNSSSSGELLAAGKSEIRILVATDVLSEGLNLQDATRMINYDIHWNPVRLMQRIGRVDRRMSPEIEEQIRVDHPDSAGVRGDVIYWNFLPPDELNQLLTLYRRVTQKVLLISKTLGIEGKKLLTPDDDYAALRELNHAYEGTKSVLEELQLEYRDLTREDPELMARLEALPGAIFSGKEALTSSLQGAFFCYSLPALDTKQGIFTYEAGMTKWYFYDAEGNEVLEDLDRIAGTARSARDTPRTCVADRADLVTMRSAIQKHIKNTYLKRVDAPMGVDPKLRCWMEVSAQS